MYKNKYFKSIIRFIQTVKDVSKNKGILYGAFVFIRIIYHWVISHYAFHIIKSLPKTFSFKLGTYPYFFHRYNKTWRNERAVEVPVIWDIVNRYNGKRILEVGNVLSHYFSTNHEIVDKYEISERVVNIDIVDFKPVEKFDLIVSISTLEHVGWDETPRDPVKILHAIDNLKKCLLPGGKIFVTLLMGYNTEMDKLLRNEDIKFSERYCLKRISKNNKWEEVEWKDIQDTKFWYPFPNANGLIIGIIENN
jgi:SAM-dependent methyltransferase